MKISFDWQNIMSQKDMNKSMYHTKDPNVEQKNVAVDLSKKVEKSCFYTRQESVMEEISCGISASDYVAGQRDKMVLMSNSMSPEDFHKMKEDGYSVSSMDPEEIVTILDTIKTELAKSGTHVAGYTDTVSTEVISEITGSSGYAQAIVSELKRANAPVTEENIHQIDEVVDQALTLSKPGEGNTAYLVAKQMEPTIANLYKAGHSSLNINSDQGMTGYASSEYSRYGMNQGPVRKTAVTKEELSKMEDQVKERIQQLGVKVSEDSVQNGQWLIQKGIPLTKENLELLEEIKEIQFPLDITKIIRQAALAIGEGQSPLNINVNKKAESIYDQAVRLKERYDGLSYTAADYAAADRKPLTLLSMEQYQGFSGNSQENIAARKTLEEVRLKMTVEANLKLLQSGYSIDTAPMEELITALDRAASEWEEGLFGTDQAHNKAALFRETTARVGELPGLPLVTIGKFADFSSATITEVVEEGRILKQDFELAKQSYETMMTAPRPDMGDSIKKAFRNVDDILEDMGMEITEANQRAIRIMGYNQIAITEDNLDRVKEADKKVRTVIDKLKPAMTLEMIREGKNPLEMSMEEIHQYIAERENEFVTNTEKYSEFLYKLEKKNQISEEERKAYIGIYRLLRQIEKSDGGVIGSLIAGESEINFSNLLSAVRSKKARGTDIRVDDSIGTLEKVIERGVSISDQIEAMKEIERDPNLNHLLEKEQLQQIRETIKNTGKEKEYLESYQQTATIDHLQSAYVLTRKRGETFRKVIELEENMTEEGMEETILENAKEFLEGMERREERKLKYSRMIENSKDLLEESIERRDYGHLDLKELQSVYKQLTLAHQLSEEENYEVPIRIGEEITSINLKVIHRGDEYGSVKITMDTKEYGQVEARFIMTEDGLEGSVLTDYMDKKDRLQLRESELKEAIEEALEETKIELKSLFFGTNGKLDINGAEKSEGSRKKDLSILYKVAKNFVRYISQEEKRATGWEAENDN